MKSGFAGSALVVGDARGLPNAGLARQIAVPTTFPLLDATFERVGQDLVGTSTDGSKMVFAGFFESTRPPDLAQTGGIWLSGGLIVALAAEGGAAGAWAASTLDARAPEISPSPEATAPAADETAPPSGNPMVAAAAEPSAADPSAPPEEAALETSPGGDENALTGDLITVTAPPNAFDIRPSGVPLADANLTPISPGGFAYIEPPRHEDELLLFSRFPSELEPQTQLPGPKYATLWDNGVPWSILGAVDETRAATLELSLDTFRRIAPRENYMAVLSATGASTNQIGLFLNVAPDALAALAPASKAVEGAAMHSLNAVQLAAGSHIRFDVFFDAAGNAQFNDVALMTVSTASGTAPVTIGSIQSLGGLGATGWLTIDYTARTTGAYTFGFAVINDDDSSYSRLFVDNRRISATATFAGDTFEYREVSTGSDEQGVLTRLLKPLPGFIEPVQAVTLPAGGTLTINALANVIDPDPFDAPVFVGTLTEGTRGSLSSTSAGIVTYSGGEFFRALAEGVTGTDHFGYIVDGGSGGSQATARVEVTMTGVNDAPEARDDTAKGLEDAALTGNVLTGAGADRDVDGDALFVASQPVAMPQHGTVVLRADGSFTYTPAADFNGTDSFTYRVSDGRLTDDATVTLTVASVNDAPIGLADVAQALQSGPQIAIDVLANDYDIDDAHGTLTVASATVARGQVSIAGDQRLIYDPGKVAAFASLAEGATTTETITYTVRDPHGAQATASVAVTIVGVNDAPTARPDTAAAIEDGAPVVINVLANDDDIDTDDNSATLKLVSAVSTLAGPLSIAADGTIVYDIRGITAFDRLAQGQTVAGFDTITYTIADRHGATATSQVAVSVTGTNDAPLAVDDRFTQTEDRIDPLAVLANDIDPDAGDRLTITRINGQSADIGAAIDLPSGATVTVGADGRLVYAPGQLYNSLGGGEVATDAFTYGISDGHGGPASQAQVTLTIAGVNDAPVAVADTVGTDEDAAVRIAVLANDSDPDVKDQLIVRGVDTAGTLGDVSVNADGTVTYDPNGRFDALAAGETATDSFRYVADDGHGGRSTATVTVTVHGVATPQTAPQQLLQSFEEAQGLVVAGWGREPGQQATVQPVSLIGTFTGEIAAFQPTHLATALQLAAFGGSAIGPGIRQSALESFLDLPGGALPDDNGAFSGETGDRSEPNVAAGIATRISLDSADVGTDGRITVVFDWNFLSAENVGDNEPGANDYAVFSISDGETWKVFTLDDARTVGLGASGWRRSSFDITSAFALPAAGDLFLTLGFGVVNDQTPDNPSSLLIDNVRLNREIGTDYTLIGSGAGDAFQTFRQNPLGIDDAVAAVGSTPISEDAIASLAIAPLLANDLASRGATAASLKITSVTGAATLAGDHIDFDPRGRFDQLREGQTATDTFRYTVTDANGGSDSATVTVTIAGVNDAPVAAADRVQGVEDTILSGNVLLDNGAGADHDPEGDTLSVSPTALTKPAHGTLVLNADGSFAYTPSENFHGVDGFSYRLSDGRLTTVGNVTLVVDPVNDAPIAGADTATTDQNLAVAVAVAANDRDPDGDALHVIAVAGSSLVVGQSILLTSGAQVALQADGTLLYDPHTAFDYLRPGETASDSFRYTIGDGMGGSGDGNVTVTVHGLNDHPVPSLDPISTDANTVATLTAGQLLANDRDPDLGDTLHVVAIDATGAIGSVRFENGNVSYDPNGHFRALAEGDTAIDTFHYRVADSFGAEATGEIRVTVAGVNDAPNAADDTGATAENRPVTLDVLGNDSDPDAGDTLSIVGLGTNGTLGRVSVNADGTLTYDPDGRFDSLRPGETASDYFTYTIDDGHGGQSTADVSVTIDGRSNVERIVDSFELPLQVSQISFGSSDTVASVVQHVETDGAHGVFGPTDGSHLARLEAYGTTQPSLKDFLGVDLRAQFPDADGSLPAQGAALRLRLELQAGDELSFDWLFDARDTVSAPGSPADNDFAVFTISDSHGSQAFKLSDVRQTGDYGASGWHSSMYRADTDGEVTIGFAAVKDRISDFPSASNPASQNSVLLVDNVRVNRDFSESYQVVDSQASGHFETLIRDLHA